MALYDEYYITNGNRRNFNVDMTPPTNYEAAAPTPVRKENGTMNLDRLGELISRFSDGRHPEMVAALQRQLDAETARINQGYQNARNEFAQIGANIPETYDLARDYQHAQNMNAINYDQIRRNQAAAPRQAGFYNVVDQGRFGNYDTANEDAMAYQAEQRRIAEQQAAERAYLKYMEEQKLKGQPSSGEDKTDWSAYMEPDNMTGMDDFSNPPTVSPTPNVYTEEDDPEFRSTGTILPDEPVVAAKKDSLFNEPLFGIPTAKASAPEKASAPVMSNAEKLNTFDSIFGGLSEQSTEKDLIDALNALKKAGLTKADAANLRYYDAWSNLEDAIRDYKYAAENQKAKENLERKLGQQQQPKQFVIPKPVNKGKFARTQ